MAATRWGAGCLPDQPHLVAFRLGDRNIVGFEVCSAITTVRSLVSISPELVEFQGSYLSITDVPNYLRQPLRTVSENSDS
jgi:hypothetical protein